MTVGVTSPPARTSRLLVHHFRRVLLTLRLILPAWAFSASAADLPDPARARPEDFWGLTNLYSFHLTIALEEWAKMEPASQASGAMPGFGGPVGLGGAAGEGGPGRMQPGPMMGLEFEKGKGRLEFQGRDLGFVSVRFKGNSSFNAARNSIKRSLKLDFNDEDPERTFFGMTKLNLNNGAMDPSVMRESLAYEVLRRAGIPASRTAFARVYLTVPGKYTRQYAGLYTVVEQVDGKFLKAHFGEKSGLLLKPERVQGLPYLGDNWAAYERQFEEKSNVKTKETKRFIAFTKLINQSTDADFAAKVKDFMDLEAFLRFLAAQALLANLDSPLLTGHNYYLYLDPGTDRFACIPWDMNEAFGGFRGGGSEADIVNLSIRKPFTRANRLAERILALEGIAQQYEAIVRGLLKTNFTAARLTEEMEVIAGVIRSAVEEDRRLSLPLFERNLAENPTATVAGFDGGRRVMGGEDRPQRGGQGFLGLGAGLGPMEKPPLRQFVAARIKAITDQLDNQREGYVPVMMNRRGGPGMGGPGMGPGMGPGFAPGMGLQGEDPQAPRRQRDN